MSQIPNPYEADLGTRDALEALGETPARIRAAVEAWSVSDFERRYAPGKWSIRLVLIHLAQTELALGARARFAASQPGYVAQPFSQDDWLPLDSGVDARTALDVYSTLRRLNLAFFAGLTAEQRSRTFTHPEYGALTPGWIMAQMAGHDIHHLRQIEMVTAGSW